ncbi:hypothetical protein V8G54_019211 [Vigna mungo]|uniref:Uncharacterized protein n=1 Tax=Vigna mungo TaxID=3915 RepID=A0AAQ3N9K0_VIGMU
MVGNGLSRFCRILQNSAEFWPSGFVGLRRMTPSLDRSVCVSWSEKGILVREGLLLTVRFGCLGQRMMTPSLDRSRRVTPSLDRSVWVSWSEKDGRVTPSLDRLVCVSWSEKEGLALLLTVRSIKGAWSRHPIQFQWFGHCTNICDGYCETVRMVEVYDVCMINMALEEYHVIELVGFGYKIMISGGLTHVVRVVGGPRVDAITGGLYCSNRLALCMVGSRGHHKCTTRPSSTFILCPDVSRTVGDDVPLEQALETEEDPAPSERLCCGGCRHFRVTVTTLEFGIFGKDFGETCPPSSIPNSLFPGCSFQSLTPPFQSLAPRFQTLDTFSTCHCNPLSSPTKSSVSPPLTPPQSSGLGPPLAGYLERRRFFAVVVVPSGLGISEAARELFMQIEGNPERPGKK